MKFFTKKKNFLFLLLISFMFISTSAMAITNQIPDLKQIFLQKLTEKKDFPPVPVLKSDRQYPVLSAQSVLAYDVKSGVSLYEKNPDLKLLPASTTKIITALVALDNYPIDGFVKVDDFYIEGQKMGLVKGEIIKIEDLLYGILVYSANDAAEVLARVHPDGRDGFIAAMNKKAVDLGMQNSNFINPVGLDGNTSSAKDMVLAAKWAMRNQEFAKIVGTKNKVVKSADQKITHRLKNINELLGSVDGVLGIKTGWTENARENLISYVSRDNHDVIIALLGSQDRFGETKELIDWVYASYDWENVDPYSE